MIFRSGLKQAEERIRELEDKSFEISESEEHKKKLNTAKRSCGGMTKESDICSMEVLEKK